jgi:hypothetical protein
MQEKQRTLINGRMMLCPRCKKEHPVESYMRLREIEEFKSETTPIYKCESCKWIFALSVYVPQEVYEQLAEFFSQPNDSTRKVITQDAHIKSD